MVTFDGGSIGQVVDDRMTELACSSMREYFERGGDVEPTGKELALDAVRLEAPIVPKKFFHTAGNYREHHEESLRVDWSHPVLPWIVLFQNVDAIVGPDEAVVYPETLTEELDYELELAVVISPAANYLRPGDVVEAEIENIGVLRNPVVAWSEAHGAPVAATAQA